MASSLVAGKALLSPLERGSTRKCSECARVEPPESRAHSNGPPRRPDSIDKTWPVDYVYAIAPSVVLSIRDFSR